MSTGIAIRKNEYYDSVFLMGINNRIMKEKGVLQSAVLMGSDANKDVLRELKFKESEITKASANDLIVGVIAQTQEIVDQVLGNLAFWLTEVQDRKPPSEFHTLGEAIAHHPQANLVSISIPGEYAAHETRKSLESGLNVFLFSDNVSIEDEVSLKKYAQSKELLVMGPDCGTSLIGGIGLGFSNVIRRGSIGVIAAAGSGLQEFTCMVHNAGYGISHAIGTGGRDLSDAIEGLTTLSALDILENDPGTQVIVILSKPPGVNTLKKLVERFRKIKKPVVGCFIGIEGGIDGEGSLFHRAKIIDEAVEISIKLIGGILPESKNELPHAQRLKIEIKKDQKYIRGVFAGGTFCFQAQQILKDAGIKVYSNTPIEKNLKLAHPDTSKENSLVDMGDEYYMVGRPHPMINGSQRALRILREARDPEVAVILLDFILGYNASMDPVGELVDAIQEARKLAGQQGGYLEIVSSICGTNEDPQDLILQTRMLKNCGVIVFQSNAEAVQYCVELLKEINHV